jgi:polyphenol oxidase
VHDVRTPFSEQVGILKNSELGEYGIFIKMSSRMWYNCFMKKYLQQFPEIVAILSEKEDGSMRLSEKGTTSWKNREIFLLRNKIGIENVVSARLAHGIQIVIVSENDKEDVIENTDGLVTKSPKTFLAVTAADCVPIFFYESKKKIVALSHSGWKGTVGNIAKDTVAKIIEMGGEAENILVALGAGINACHYDMSEDRLDKFSKYREFIQKRDGKIFADLKGIIRKQLIAVGVKPKNIENDPDCTYCSKNFFSHHRDKSDPIETMLAVIGIN